MKISGQIQQIIELFKKTLIKCSELINYIFDDLYYTLVLAQNPACVLYDQFLNANVV